MNHSLGHHRLRYEQNVPFEELGEFKVKTEKRYVPTLGIRETYNVYQEHRSHK